MRLEFNKPPNICNADGHTMKLSKIDAKGEFIDVIFDTGFDRERLLSLLSEMVCAKKANVTNFSSFIRLFYLDFLLSVWYHTRNSETVE